MRYTQSIKSIYLLVIFMLGTCFFDDLYGQEIKTVNNLEANSEIAYYDLEQGKAVSDENGAWDISFYKTNIALNPGTNGRGQVKAKVLQQAFDKTDKAQTKTGLQTDQGEQLAIPAGSGNGWYEYNMADHTINPIKNHVILVKTRSGKLYKLEILNYYSEKDYSPANYSFRYALLQ
ncbi:MAG: HmuY family protein [Sphingobacterium sp.]|uniref:HmuY family protein n=1 Tax=Sphingobacterium sp. JB170 TaxID=1434842 RepID=UPI000B356FB3|nr:HmuY family protein [Sphingobacterium sp. JB170]